MAKTILEELEALVGKDAASKIAAKSDVMTRLQEGERLYRFYTGDDEPEPIVTPPVTTTPPPAVTTPPAVTPTATTTTSSDNKTILSELGTLLDTRFKAFEERVVTMDKLPNLEGQVLTKALRMSHDIARIENNHEKEFGEQLDLDKFNTWYEEQKKAGANFGTIPKAYDFYVQERRVEAKIKLGIEEGVKQKQSSTAVPAVTTSVALSPAQQVLHDARKTETTGESNAQKAARRLAELAKSRDGSAA